MIHLNGVWTPKTVIGTLVTIFGLLQLYGGTVILLFAATTQKEVKDLEIMAKMGSILAAFGSLIAYAGYVMLT